jgi:hypothetical protein
VRALLPTPIESRKRDRFCLRVWNDLLRGCSAVEVFDFFQLRGLAAYPHRHHCLAALRSNNGARNAASPIE